VLEKSLLREKLNLDWNAVGAGFKPAVEPVLVENELKDSFLDYAMSVVVSPGFGLTPAHADNPPANKATNTNFSTVTPFKTMNKNQN